MDVPGTVGYFHPLPDQRALVVGSRSDVGEGSNRQTRSWVQVQLLDVSDPDAPRIAATWERPWAVDAVGSDHHAFTFWPERNLAMWGIRNSEPGSGGVNYAIALATEGSVTEVAAPPANKPDETPAPCPVVDVTDPDAQKMIGPGGVVLRCADPAVKELEWPRYQCYRIDDGLLATFAPDQVGQAAFVLAHPLRNRPFHVCSSCPAGRCSSPTRRSRHSTRQRSNPPQSHSTPPTRRSASVDLVAVNLEARTRTEPFRTEVLCGWLATNAAAHASLLRERKSSGSIEEGPSWDLDRASSSSSSL